MTPTKEEIAEALECVRKGQYHLQPIMGSPSVGEILAAALRAAEARETELRKELVKVYHDKGVWEECSNIHARGMRVQQERAEKAESENADLRAQMQRDRDAWCHDIQVIVALKARLALAEKVVEAAMLVRKDWRAFSSCSLQQSKTECHHASCNLVVAADALAAYDAQEKKP